jgi:hypothetical protein
MKTHYPLLAFHVALVSGSLLGTALAGTLIQDNSKGKAQIEPEKPVNGALTFGYQGSEHLNTGYIDLLQPLFSPSSNVALFYDGRFSFDDSDQTFQSHGLVFRYRIPDRDVIIGANVYYDSLDSAYDHHFDQAGVGLEVLTKWVDARANYYLPDQKREQIARTTRRETIRDIERGFAEDVIRDTDLRRDFARFESPLEGFNTELGFLIPGLDRYAEVRLFGGYYHYLNPFGSDYDGFKARLEARIRRGLTAEVEYWDDKILTGGHWTGGVRVSLPFNFGNIFAGRNPFEGASEAFGPPSGDFGDRMTDFVVRSHRVKTTTSGFEPIGTHIETREKRIPKNLPPPSTGGGGGGETPPEGSQEQPQS